MGFLKRASPEGVLRVRSNSFRNDEGNVVRHSHSERGGARVWSFDTNRCANAMNDRPHRLASGASASGSFGTSRGVRRLSSDSGTV